MIVSSSSSRARAVINFKEGSSWGGSSSRNKIEGTVFDRDGRSAVDLVGRWDESIDRKVGETGFERLWSIKEFQKSQSRSVLSRACDALTTTLLDPEKHYGFSQFAIQLNEITQLERDWLPTSDSRLRPDQIALELGNVDEAEETKIRVEEKQREKRKIENEQGGHVPEHFQSNGEGWTFTGDYCTSSLFFSLDATLADDTRDSHKTSSAKAEGYRHFLVRESRSSSGFGGIIICIYCVVCSRKAVVVFVQGLTECN